MQIYILLALLPCILAADIPVISCPDGNICPVGQTCCKNNEHYECCDIPESDKQNKKLVPAIFYGQAQNVSSSYSCTGTSCSSMYCCPFVNAACCSMMTCCPGLTRCCSSPGSSDWCCKKNQRCANTYMYCFAGAASISPTFAAMLLIFFGIVASKHFI